LAIQELAPVHLGRLRSRRPAVSNASGSRIGLALGALALDAPGNQANPLTARFPPWSRRRSTEVRAPRPVWNRPPIPADRSSRINRVGPNWNAPKMPLPWPESRSPAESAGQRSRARLLLLTAVL